MIEETTRNTKHSPSNNTAPDGAYATGGRGPAGTPSTAQPLNPGWLVPLTVIAGLTASGPIAGATLLRCGCRKPGWVLGVSSGVLGLLFFMATILWKVEWYWASLSLTGSHLLCGTGLFFVLRGPYRRFREIHPLPPTVRGSYREIIAGIAGGVFIGGLMGLVCTVLYILFVDRLFSTLVPVIFDDIFAGTRVFFGAFFLTASGGIAGGCIGRFKPDITPGQIILYSLGLAWAHHTWLMATEGAIAIPAFQAGAATGAGWGRHCGAVLPVRPFHRILVVGLSSLLYHFGPWQIGKLHRAVQVAGINVAAVITLSISFGYPAEMFLALGRHFERGALTAKALYCYEQGLTKEPKHKIASYLQYRIALLNHKLGNQDKAKQGFRRVVAKYTSNEKLVKKANRFLDSLERSAGKKRVVLPGVETRTEYKGGYCVPNSLAVAMRYWGSDVTARRIGKRITGLGSGTFIVNQTWFAGQEGFRHDFLPMAGLDDIKQCVDAGFPVLVYVPAHIFAIVGYDEALETFITYDVATHDVWVEYTQKDFIKAWKKQATTLVLAYPPEKAAQLPENIRDRLIRLSDNYLHYQLHFFDAPTNTISIPHLFAAAGDSGEFFFPITILYDDFPGLRKTIAERYATEAVVDSIRAYFWEDFDEGIHLWGQYHDERWARPDWALTSSIHYLIGRKRFDLVEELVTRIDEEGQVSEGMLGDIGVIDLARGQFARGLDRLKRAGEDAKPLYVGLANVKIQDKQGAIRALVKTLKRGA